MGLVAESLRPQLPGINFSPLASWKLNEGVTSISTTFADYSGNSKTLSQDTLMSSMGTLIIGEKGVSGGRFKRIDSDFLLSSALSVSVIANITGGSGILIGYYGGDGSTQATNQQWTFGIYSPGMLGYAYETGSGTQTLNTSSQPLLFGSWQHFGFVRSGTSSVQIYINGFLSASFTGLGAPDGGGSSSLYGLQHTNGTETFLGGIGSLEVYNTALSASQMAYLARRSIGR